MTVTIAYTSVSMGPRSLDYAARFVASYSHFPPGEPHRLFIISNGGPPARDVALTLSLVSNEIWPRSNKGWDIGGYLEAARGPLARDDMIVCLGESCYFTRADWLTRLVECWNKFGPGMYGFWSSNAVRTHMNTTGFAIAPKFLWTYPLNVDTRLDRYAFEHGELAMWRRLASLNIPTKLVTWDGCWEPKQWRIPNNILWRGDQSNMLLRCNHADAYEAVNSQTRASWQLRCDAPFK